MFTHPTLTSFPGLLHFQCLITHSI